MSDKTITLRDHEQPCEHWEPLGLDPNRWAYSACDWAGCPGGRERIFRYSGILPTPHFVSGETNELVLWVEVTDEPKESDV